MAYSCQTYKLRWVVENIDIQIKNIDIQIKKIDIQIKNIDILQAYMQRNATRLC